MDSSCTDGKMIEQTDILGRLTALEIKSRQHEDEIVCLKSAMSDLIRRMQLVDKGKVPVNGTHSTILPSKPAIRMPMLATANSQNAFRTNLSSLRPVSVPVLSAVPSNSTISKARPSSPLLKSSSLKKWPSLSTSPTDTSAPTDIASAGPSDVGLISADDLSLRLVLRGRSVAMFAPTSLPDYKPTQRGTLPSERLKLEWVYGYRGKDARNNLFVLASGEVVYFIAATVVIYHLDAHSQRFYLEHNDDVKSLAVHPDRVTVATGQVAGHDKKEGKPHVRVWDSLTLTTLRIIGVGDMDRAVGCVAFSKVDYGHYLLAVDESNEHVMSIWDWQKGDRGVKVAETKTSGDVVLCAEFSPRDKMQMVTCGKGHVAFWSLDSGVFTKRLGLFEKHDKPKFISCLTFTASGDVITGDSSGSLLIWSKGSNKIAKVLSGVHGGGVSSMCALSDGAFITGGRDGRLIQWDYLCQKMGTELEVPGQYGPVRSVAISGDRVVVGTTKNALAISPLLIASFSPITEGHTDELWGVASHPCHHQFVSTGNDGLLYIWDALTHVSIAVKQLAVGVHCCSYHTSGGVIAVGCVDGWWYVLDANTRDVVHSHRDGNDCINCMAYSPDGNYLAIGSKSGYIVVYSTVDGGLTYCRVGKCQGHTSAVTHVDWSVDSQYMQSNSTDYELLFWSVPGCQQVRSAQSMRDVQWATHMCTIAFASAGIWQEGEDGTDINACAKANKRPLLASADDFGRVNLYRFPSCYLKSPRQSYGGHSSHVTNVVFLHDDLRLLSTGGGDGAILQWAVHI